MIVKMEQNLRVAKDGWNQLKESVSFQKYVSCDNHPVKCDTQTSEQTVHKKITSDMSKEEKEEEEEEKDYGRKSKPPTFLSAVDRINTVTKYIIRVARQASTTM
jgi:hypothetical protein